MNWKPIIDGASKALPIAALAGTAGLAAVEAGGEIRKHMQIAATEKHLIDANPELADFDQQKIKDYFDVVKLYSPQAARNPLVAGSLVHKMLQFGGVDHKLVQDIAGLEKNKSGFGEPLARVMSWKSPDLNSESDSFYAARDLKKENERLRGEGEMYRADIDNLQALISQS